MQVNVWIQILGTEQAPFKTVLLKFMGMIIVFFFYKHLKYEVCIPTFTKFNFHHYEYFHIQIFFKKYYFYVWFALCKKNHYKMKFPFGVE